MVIHQTEQYTIDLIIHQCPTCHTYFGVDRGINRDYYSREIHNIWCPKGHAMVPKGRTEAEILREELAATEAALAGERSRCEATSRSRAAFMGIVRKMKNDCVSSDTGEKKALRRLVRKPAKKVSGKRAVAIKKAVRSVSKKRMAL